MLLTSFPALQPSTIGAINTTGQWLAQNDFTPAPQVGDIDLIVLAGNAMLPVIDAACQFAATSGLPLVITGGIGHSTTFLYAAIAQHPRYNTIPTTGRPEAAILKDIATRFWKVPADNIYTELKSTNCGENAHFTRQLLREASLSPQRVMLIQDPTLQRRTVATFTRAWQDEQNQPEWLSWPGIVPELTCDERSTHFVNDVRGFWSVERYITLVLGEIPRLRNDASGYGPKGRDFITLVEIPPEVMAAWQALQQDVTLSRLMRERGL